MTVTLRPVDTIGDILPVYAASELLSGADAVVALIRHRLRLYNNETIECSVGVQHFTKRNKKWTHWAIPAGLEGGDPIIPKPTLKRGATGESVILLQTKLSLLSYNLGPAGIDGIFGKATLAAVQQFQRDNHLTPDGIVGPATWAKLEEASPASGSPAQSGSPSSAPAEQQVTLSTISTAPTYTVTIPHLPESQAKSLAAQYPGSTMTVE